MRFKQFIVAIALGLHAVTFSVSTATTSTETPRIITLAPHLTEMVYDLGLEAQLVARDDASNYPEAVKNIPSVGSGLNPSKERLLLYEPDILLSYHPHTQLAKLFPNQHVDIINSAPSSVYALFDDWRRVLALAQKDANKRSRIEAEINAIESEWQHLVEDYKNKDIKKVFFLISEQPLFSLSDMTFLSQAVKGCHTENIFADIKQASFIVNIEDLILRAPDIIIHGVSTTSDIDKKRAREATLKLFENIGIKLRTEQLLTMDADILHRPTQRFMKELPNICEAIHRE